MEKNVLVMIPGPTPVVKSIQEQMGREIQAFGDPRFVKDYKELNNVPRCSTALGKRFRLLERVRWRWKWPLQTSPSAAIIS